MMHACTSEVPSAACICAISFPEIIHGTLSSQSSMSAAAAGGSSGSRGGGGGVRAAGAAFAGGGRGAAGTGGGHPRRPPPAAGPVRDRAGWPRVGGRGPAVRARHHCLDSHCAVTYLTSHLHPGFMARRLSPWHFPLLGRCAVRIYTVRPASRLQWPTADVLCGASYL